MSVSLALIPVALALRVAMGKDNFENWVNSMQVKIASTFKDEGELAKTVNKAGYHTEKWGGLLKTHIKGENKFFFWEYIDGKWYAVFSKSDSKELIDRFTRDLETKTMRKIFQSDRETKVEQVVPKSTFPTNFREADLLMKTLRDYGANSIKHSQGEIKCDLGKYTLIFRQAGDAPFNVEIEGSFDQKELFQHILAINDNYCSLVQQQAYKNVIQRAKQRGFKVESEEIKEDNSVVVTLAIR